MGHSQARKRVTLAAVARLAGVAESTASRVMNGYTRNFRVRPEVRQRVLDAARHLNYKPNPMVRSIAAKRTNLIAIIGNIHDEEIHAGVQAAARVLIGAGKHVCTSFLDPDDGPFVVPSWRVDGAIAVRPSGHRDLEALEAQEIPCVTIDGAATLGDSVSVDQADAVRIAFEHLHGRGHETTALVDLGENRPVALARRESYQRLCDWHGVSPAHFSMSDNPGSAAEILRGISGSGGIGVIASAPSLAMRLLQAASGLGLRTPDDLSIVCLGDTEMTRLATPALTCVRQPFEAIGAAAARMLLDRLECPTDPTTLPLKVEYFTGELIVRSSTSAPVVN